MLSPARRTQLSPTVLRARCGHAIPVRVVYNGVRDQLLLTDPTAPYAAAFWDYCPYCLEPLRPRRRDDRLACLLAVPAVPVAPCTRRHH